VWQRPRAGLPVRRPLRRGLIKLHLDFGDEPVILQQAEECWPRLMPSVPPARSRCRCATERAPAPPAADLRDDAPPPAPNRPRRRCCRAAAWWPTDGARRTRRAAGRNSRGRTARPDLHVADHRSHQDHSHAHHYANDLGALDTRVNVTVRTPSAEETVADTALPLLRMGLSSGLQWSEWLCSDAHS
jgi:hypothetical protein